MMLERLKQIIAGTALLPVIAFLEYPIAAALVVLAVVILASGWVL